MKWIHPILVVGLAAASGYFTATSILNKPSITYGGRVMSVPEFKQEHERLAGYIVKLLIALNTNHVVMDRIVSTNWQLHILVSPTNTDYVIISHD